MRTALLILSLIAPCICPAEEQIHRVKQGQPAPVEGWVYPLSEHSRVVADFKAFDVALEGLQADLVDALEQLDESKDSIEELEVIEADLNGRLIAAELIAEAASADARRHSLYWGLACGLAVTLPWAGAELSYIDKPTAMTAAVTGLSAAALVAWLTGG